MADAALAQQRVFHHVGQRRRDGQRQLERRALVAEPVEELDQRDVRLRDRLEEPALLQEAVVLGVADVGQVGVKDQQQVSLRHGYFLSFQFTNSPAPSASEGSGPT